MTPEDAEEYTQALVQIGAGWWRQAALAVKLSVPEALGMTAEQWGNERLPRDIKLSVPERREAVKELTDGGFKEREISVVLNISERTVRRDKLAVGELIEEHQRTDDLKSTDMNSIVDGVQAAEQAELEPSELIEEHQRTDDLKSTDVDEKPAPPPYKPEPVMLTLLTHTGEEVKYPQPGSKSTFNETTGEGISWAAWSWNPVTGCLHGCEYCYARAIAHRFTDSYPVGFTPLFHHQRLDAPENTVIPDRYRNDMHSSCKRGDCKICEYRRVFVCSMADLYGRWVPDEWIEQVHDSMLKSPQWQYILLTKFPARYVGLKLPPNAWVGTSVDEQKRVRIAEDAFRKIEGVKVKWLSLEPLREPLEFADFSMFDWVVIGAQTETRQPQGTVREFMPPWEWICRITAQAKEAGCAVHWKPNLFNGRPGLPLNEYPG